MIPILKHQMRISTIHVSSVMLGKKKKIRKSIISSDSKELGKNPAKLGHEMEPNPLKDRAVHEGDDPLG
jgi:hypothetical protein